MTTSQDLLNLVSALNLATQMGYIDRNHARGIFMKALDESDFNTPKPQKKDKSEFDKGGDLNGAIEKG